MYYQVIKYSGHLRTLIDKKCKKTLIYGLWFLYFPHVLKCLSCFISVMHPKATLFVK